MYGIDELKELLAFGFKLQKAVTGALDDGKVNLADAAAFLPALMAAPKAFAGVNLVWAEINDLTDDERADLMDWVADQFDLPNDRIEELVEDTIDVLLQIAKLANRYANLKQA